MADIMYNLRCASCGVALRVSAELAFFACGHCGADQQVERQGGTVSLRNADATRRVAPSAGDRTAAELALRRLAGELAAVESLIRDLKSRLERVHEDSQVFATPSLTTPPSTWFAIALMIEIIVMFVLIGKWAGSRDPQVLQTIKIDGIAGGATLVLFSLLHSGEEAAGRKNYEVRKAAADRELRERLLGELADAEAEVATKQRQIAENRRIVET